MIERIRDRIATNSAFAAGQRVLAVGPGAGLIALEALGPLGPTGRIVALDLSLGALRTCRQRALAGPLGATVLPVGVMPVPSPCGMRRSTWSSLAPSSPIWRIARRPPGTASASYVPADDPRSSIRSSGTGRRAADATASIPRISSRRGQIVALLRQREQNADRAVMRNFHEREVARCFEEAGFAEIGLYRYQSSDQREPEKLRGQNSWRGHRAMPTRPAISSVLRPTPI